jgi:hypothetical protein
VTRTTAIIAAMAIAATMLVAGGVMVSARDNSSSQKTDGASTVRAEGAPELERHDPGELPAVERAARRFLSGYLPLIYAEPGATVDELHSASPRLVARLNAQPGRVPPAQAALTPRVERVTVLSEGRISALATAHIKDSSAPAYPLVFHLQKHGGVWLVTRIGGP